MYFEIAKRLLEHGYVAGDMIAHGSLGRVFHAVDGFGTEVAIKVSPLIPSAVNEIALLKLIEHPGVIKVWEVFSFSLVYDVVDEPTCNNLYVAMVMPYHGGKTPTTLTKDLAREVLTITAYLEERNIWWSDAVNNIVWTDEGNPILIDFEHAVRVKPSTYLVLGKAPIYARPLEALADMNRGKGASEPWHVWMRLNRPSVYLLGKLDGVELDVPIVVPNIDPSDIRISEQIAERLVEYGYEGDADLATRIIRYRYTYDDWQSIKIKDLAKVLEIMDWQVYQW